MTVTSELSANGDDWSDTNDWKFPLFLSCMAGASTCIGAAVVFLFSPRAIEQSMSFSLSLAASVMITVSVVSIGPECFHGVLEYENEKLVQVNTSALLGRVSSFAVGCLAYYILSKVLVTLPEPETMFSTSPKHSYSKEKIDYDTEELRHFLSQESSSSSSAASAASDASPTRRHPNNPKQQYTVRKNAQSFSKTSSTMTAASTDDVEDPGIQLTASGENGMLQTTLSINADENEEAKRKRSWRVTMLLFVSLLLHNFPEGLAVVASTVESKDLGLTVAIGIAAHNIPEGIAIAVPCIAARPDAPWLAFWLASVSGLAEPLGAAIALVVLQGNTLNLENVLAGVAGVMCMVAVVELYPEALQHVQDGDYRRIIGGSLVGMVVMIATELYLP